VDRSIGSSRTQSVVGFRGPGFSVFGLPCTWLCYAPPGMWAEKPRRFYHISLPRAQLAGLRSQEGLLTWAEKPKRSFILYFPEN